MSKRVSVTVSEQTLGAIQEFMKVTDMKQAQVLAYWVRMGSLVASIHAETEIVERAMRKAKAKDTLEAFRARRV